jgi:hypothetical protein
MENKRNGLFAADNEFLEAKVADEHSAGIRSFVE